MYVVTILVTIFLFFYWSTEENRTSLFAFNLSYAIFLESLFYGFIYIIKLKSKKVLGTTYSILGTVSFFYLLFGIISMLVFNIFLSDLISVMWYYSLIILGTLFSLIFSSFSLKLNNAQVDEAEELEEQSNLKSSLMQELKYLGKSYISALNEKGLTEKFESGYNSIIEKLENKIRYINPKDFENTRVKSKLKNQIDEINNQVTELKRIDSDGVVVQKQIIRSVNNSLDYLNSL
jgi:hypothetical protein